MNILNWPDWDILSVIESNIEVRIAAAYKLTPTVCTRCGVVGTVGEGLRKFGSFPQTIHTTPMYAKPCVIEIKRQRYQCGACGKTFSQELPEVDDKRQMSTRLLEWIQRESLTHTFADVARQAGVTEATVRNVFSEWVTYLDATIRADTPRVLGIDEMHLLNKMRCIMTDVEGKSIIALLPTRTKDAVYRHLVALPDRDRVEMTTMDMWNPYRDAVRAVWPDMTIVVDKFHITRMATSAMETVRKDIRKNLTTAQRRGMMHDRFVFLRRRGTLNEQQMLLLDTLTGQYPMLATAYELKESFFGIWDAQDGATARQMYAEWKSRVPAELAPTFQDLTTAMTNWDREVFAYFENEARGRITNAYTEAMNGIAKIANRNARGYSFEVLRAKMLYAKSAAAPTAPPRIKKIPLPKSKGESDFLSVMKLLLSIPEGEILLVDEIENGLHPHHLSTMNDILKAIRENDESTQNYG